jgi:hypothetical protein
MKPFQKAVISDAEFSAMKAGQLAAWARGDPTARAMIPALDYEAAKAMLTHELRKMRETETVYVNDKYQVHMRHVSGEGVPGVPDIVHLSVRRLDRQPIHDWRDMQHIKNMLVGRENEGVELYPAEARKVDTANQFHIWVLADPKMRFPFGYDERLVLDSTGYGKAVNRPLAKEEQ